MPIDRPTRFRDSFAAVNCGLPHRFDEPFSVAQRANAVMESLAEHTLTTSITVTMNPPLPQVTRATVLFECSSGYALIADDSTLLIDAQGTARTTPSLDEVTQWLVTHDNPDAPALARYALVDDTGRTPRDLRATRQLAHRAATDTRLESTLPLVQAFAEGLAGLDTTRSQPTFSDDGRLGSISDGGELVAIVTPVALIAVPSSWTQSERLLTTPAEVTAFAQAHVARKGA